MNYIQEINAFYERLETNPLSTGAGMLWHTLLHINNRARWVSEFSVAAAVLCYKSGLSSSSFKRARTELVENGYITFRSRGTKAPIYRVVSLTKKEAVASEDLKMNPKKENKEADIVLNQEGSEVVDQKTSPLYKQNEIKEKQKETSTSCFEQSDLYAFYVKNFGKPHVFVELEIMDWCEEVGETLVREALNRALVNEKATWAYAGGILKKWKANQLLSVVDVLKAEDTFRNKRSAKSFAPKRERSTEVIPAWFHEMKRRERGEAKRNLS